MPIHTHKIEIRIVEPDPEKRKAAWKEMRDLQYHAFKLANEMMTNLFLELYLKRQSRAAGVEQVKTKGGSDQNIAFQISKKYKDQVGSYVRGALANKVYSDYKNHEGEVAKGNETLITYRRNIVIPVAKIGLKDITQKGFLFEKIAFEWVLGNREKPDVASKVAAIEKVSQSQEWLCDSAFQIKDKKMFLLMPVKYEALKRENLPRKVAGIDLGMNVPIYFYTESGFHQPLGLNDFLSEKRLDAQEQRQFWQKNAIHAKGGHGRDRKMRKADNWGFKEGEMVKKIHHSLSKELVELCLEHDITVLRIENLTGFGDKKHFKNEVEKWIYEFVLRNWGYYDLVEKIKYKAIGAGITVEFVDPAYTSLKCADCGHTSEGNLPKITDFLCESCGSAKHADHNAAKNICHSENVKEKVKKEKKFGKTKKLPDQNTVADCAA